MLLGTYLGGTLMKPYWKDAPLWARWLAQNYNGIWHWYSEEPKLGYESWFSYNSSIRVGDNVPGFRKTLEERPK